MTTNTSSTVYLNTTCDCDSGHSGWTCELSSNISCNGHGVLSSYYPYECTCDNGFSGPNCCPPRRTGADCSQFDASAAKDELDSAQTFYFSVIFVSFFLYVVGCGCWQNNSFQKWAGRWLNICLSTLDWFSDIGFVVISLRSAYFREQYSGDADVILYVAIGLLVASSLLCFNQQYLFATEEDYKTQSCIPPRPVEGSSLHWGLTLAVFAVEDLPMFVLQGIYFNAVGIDNGDSAAIFSLCLSIVSILYTLWYLVNSICCPTATSTSGTKDTVFNKSFAA